MKFNEKFARDFAQYFVTTMVDTVCKRMAESQPTQTDHLQSRPGIEALSEVSDDPLDEKEDERI